MSSTKSPEEEAMRHPRISALILAAGVALAAIGAASAQQAAHKPAATKPAASKSAAAKPAAKPAAKSDADIIASAERAAPAAVAKNATIVTMGSDGAMKIVRNGTGAFTCMPDNPTTPGPDPMCFDKNAADWVMAWAHHQPPPQKVGFIYMLEGGTDASNTDPFATKPTSQNHWVKTGPHVMIVGDPELLKAYPASPDPDTSQPYVMWAGTPYAHLMAPVK
jgi:glucose/arabinose dehydrogenase